MELVARAAQAPAELAGARGDRAVRRAERRSGSRPRWYVITTSVARCAYGASRACGTVPRSDRRAAAGDRLGGDLLDERAAGRAQPHHGGILTRLGARAHRALAAAARGLGQRRIDRDHAIGVGHREPTDQRVVGPRQLARAGRDLDDLDAAGRSPSGAPPRRWSFPRPPPRSTPMNLEKRALQRAASPFVARSPGAKCSCSTGIWRKVLRYGAGPVRARPRDRVDYVAPLSLWTASLPSRASSPGRRRIRSLGTAWRWSTRARGELAEAWDVFSELLQQFPDYVPTYLMAGGTLVALGRKDEADRRLQQGHRSCHARAAISMLAASSSRPWPS